MSSIGSQKINATKDNKIEAGKRYTEIRDIINKNSDVPFKDVISEVAGITPGSFYNYTSPNSKKYGSVSLYTVENMGEYFNLSVGIFDCTEPFDEDAKKIIAEKVRFNFKNRADSVKESTGINTVIDQLKQLAEPLSLSSDMDELTEAIKILQKIETISKNRIDTLKSLKELNT
jgi:hypothetical protein